jgi:cell fate (sporulation/competence/biofilm development) regulator YmcA (YheA/YmcA/DUF963 family)
MLPHSSQRRLHHLPVIKEFPAEERDMEDLLLKEHK